MAYISIRLTADQIRRLKNNQDIIIYADKTLLTDNDLPSDTLLTDNDLPDTTADRSFLTYFEAQIRKQRHSGSLRTQETYRTAYLRFRRFCGNTDIPLHAFTPDLMEAYQSYLRRDDLSMNTISFHLRILRAVYKRAVEQGLTPDQYPFRHVYTGIARTSKRALAVDDLRRLRQLELTDASLAFARDLFMFSFYTRGMAFVDIAYLRRSDIRDGILCYRRRKTGQTLRLQWEEVMQDIVDRHPGHCGDYLLPIIGKQNGKERNQYRHRQAIVNRQLKQVAALAGIDQKLTMYCARHTWATIARQMEVPLSVISHGMGHSNERTTEIYLKSVDDQAVDRVNRRILATL